MANLEDFRKKQPKNNSSSKQHYILLGKYVYYIYNVCVHCIIDSLMN